MDFWWLLTTVLRSLFFTPLSGAPNKLLRACTASKTLPLSKCRRKILRRRGFGTCPNALSTPRNIFGDWDEVPENFPGVRTESSQRQRLSYFRHSELLSRQSGELLYPVVDVRVQSADGTTLITFHFSFLHLDTPLIVEVEKLFNSAWSSRLQYNFCTLLYTEKELVQNVQSHSLPKVCIFSGWSWKVCPQTRHSA